MNVTQTTVFPALSQYYFITYPVMMFIYLWINSEEISVVYKTTRNSISKLLVVDEFHNREGERAQVTRELKFVDSFRFMPSNLEQLTSNLDKNQFVSLGLKGKIWPLDKPTLNWNLLIICRCNEWLQWKGHNWLSKETLNWELEKKENTTEYKSPFLTTGAPLRRPPYLACVVTVT